MIQSIFQDEGRPLYRLCKKIRLERISSEHYKDHLNIAAKMMWKAPLPQDVFEKIMTLTERHPYYVNNLCDSLWSLYDELPDQKAVDATCMPTTSVAKALQLLLSKDFIEEADKGGYRVINPVYQFVLAE